MNIENLHNSLDDESTPEVHRQELVAFLKDCSNNLPEGNDERRQIAYAIAGFMSTEFARSLDPSDPLDQILTLAGELEVPDEDTESKWQEFRRLIHSL